MSQLKADTTEWNRLEAEIIGGQGSTTGCSAIGWMSGYSVCVCVLLYVCMYVYLYVASYGFKDTPAQML